MKHKHFKHLFTVLLLLCATMASAYDFEVDGIYYNILSETDKTVAVTFKGTSYYEYSNEYSGSVVIPETVVVSGTKTFDAWTSTNKSNSTTSQTSYTLNVAAGNILKFDWSVSSESNYDWLIITLDGTEIVKKSGTLSGSYEKTFDTAGSHTLVVKYTKDSSQSSGNDKGRIYNITLSSVGSVNDVVYSVTSIGEDAFGYCNSLTSITIPNSVTSIGQYAFYCCTKLTSITIPNSVTSIGDYAFDECTGLTRITIPSSVTSIGVGVFWFCTGLTSIEIPNSVTSIGDSAFFGCSGLTSITIPNSVTSIGNAAFCRCTSLTSITIPGSVKSIGNSAFQGCSGLKSVTSFATIAPALALGSQTFYGISSTAVLNYPFGSDYSSWSGFFASTKELAGNCGANVNWTLGDGVLTISGNGAMDDFSYACAPWYGYRDEITMVVIEDGVTSIGNQAFCDCSRLTSVVIGNSVTSIGGSAFYNCSGLTSIEIPNSVTSIGNYAFNNCTELKTVYNFSNLTFSKDSEDYGYVACYADKVYNAPNGFIDGDFIWYENEDGMNLAGYLGNATELALPADYNGKSVTSIGDWAFEGCTSLTSIEIPNSVTSIGERAFADCSGLTSIEIPNSVTSIESYAFNNCSGLKEVYINDLSAWCNISFGGSYANPLYYAKNLYFNGKLVTELVIPDDVKEIKDYAFINSSRLTSVEIPSSVTSIGHRAFADCWSLTSVEIPNSVTSIGNKAFCECKRLTSVEIPNSVTSIGDYAFEYCSSLTSITIPNSVTSIGERAFSHSGLRNITIGNSVTSIGSDAFFGCTWLKTVYNFSNLTFSKGSGSYGDIAYYADKVFNAPNGFIDGDFVWFENEGGMTLAGYLGNATELALPADYNGKSVTSIGERAFYGCTALTSIVIPNSVTSIGSRAFYDCDGLTSVVIPNSVTSIGNQAFCICTGLKNVTIGNSVTSIGDGAFGYCISLTSITIPNSVTSIGSSAFNGCSALSSVVIGNSVTSIGDYAFFGCTGLTSITIPNSVTSIGSSAFSGCSALSCVVIGKRVTSIGNIAFDDCTGLKTVVNFSRLAFTKRSSSYGYIAYYADKVFNAPNGFIDGDFVWFENEGGMTLAGYLGDVTELTLPVDYNGKSVTSIGSYAFYGCTGLSSIVIPNSVTSIGLRAFDDCCGLTSITIPNSVKSIGNAAFYNCSGLTSIEIPSCVTSIGNSAFQGCTRLKTVINFSNLTLSKGSNSNGYVAYYANKVFNAPNGFIDGDFVWFENEGGMVLASYLGDATGLTLPADYNGKSVTSIGNDAFYGCTGLTSIEIPNSVTSIGDYAFYGCTALKTVINNSDLDIEEGSTSNGYVAYYADEVIKFELVDGVYTLVKYRSKGAKQEETTTFDSWTSTNKGQSSSTSSYKYTFDAAVGSKLSFDWSVSSEASYDGLFVILDGTVILTESGEYSGIYEQTFTVAGSHTLEVKYIKDEGIDSNNDEAKIDNVKLTKTFYIPADVVLPDNYEGKLYVIGESAFENNENVASVTIPEGVEMICDKAFSGCSNLENIVIPNSVSAIGGDAFAGTKWYDNKEDGMVYAGNVLYKYKGSMPENTAITINDGTLGVAGLAFANCTGLTSITSLIPADNLFVPGSDAFVGVDKTNCTLYVPYGAKETYAATEGWEDFENIVEIIPAEITITINQYGCATFCSDLALDFSNVEGLKAYAATGYKSNSQVVTLTRVQTAEAGVGLFLKGEPGEYVIPVIESTDEHSLNMLVGTLEQTVVNSTEGEMSNYKFTIADGDAAPMFYPFEDNTTFSAGKAYLQIPTAWLPVTAQKSLNIRFDEGEITDIDELKGEGEMVKTIYDLQGRVVENPTNGIYIIDGKKVIIK